jgi:general secretion pathway protein K
MSGHCKLHQRADDGFIVVAVLWMLGALGALASIYSVYVVNTATGFAVHDDRIRAEAFISAALELAAYGQLSTPQQSRPSRGAFRFRLGQTHGEVQFRSEAARIDLNAAPAPMLAGLFTALGVRSEDAETYADRIIRHRNAPSKQDEAARSSSGVGIFAHPRELLTVHDLPRALAERALPFVTVYSGRPQVNILDAAPEVLAALPGITRERVEAVLAERQAPQQDRQALLALLGTAQQYATLEASRAIRLRAHVASEHRNHFDAEVVILIFEDGNVPYSILSRRDVFEPESEQWTRL